MALSGLIAKSLLTAHGFIAGATGQPLWKLDEAKGEPEEIAGAVSNVLRHYDVPGLSEKTADWIMLAQVLGMSYGSRIFAARMMARNAAPRPTQQRPAAQVPAAVPVSDEASAGPKPGPDFVLASPGHGLPKVWVRQQ